MDEAEAEVTGQISQEMEQVAAQRARYRAKAARWDIDVAVFFFAVLSVIMILLFQGVGVEVVAPAAALGLALGWLMGWRKERQVYERFYNEELSKLELELMKTKQTIEEQVQKALRERLR